MTKNTTLSLVFSDSAEQILVKKKFEAGSPRLDALLLPVSSILEEEVLLCIFYHASSFMKSQEEMYT